MSFDTNVIAQIDNFYFILPQNKTHAYTKNSKKLETKQNKTNVKKQKQLTNTSSFFFSSVY